MRDGAGGGGVEGLGGDQDGVPKSQEQQGGSVCVRRSGGLLTFSYPQEMRREM